MSSVAIRELNVFRDGDFYVFALTYGSDVQWVKNVLAAGSAELQIGGNRLHLTDPELFVDPKRRLMPLPVRLILALLNVNEFLRSGRLRVHNDSGGSVGRAACFAARWWLPVTRTPSRSRGPDVEVHHLDLSPRYDRRASAASSTARN